MDLSHFLARVIGFYLIITAVLVLANTKGIQKITEGVLKSSGVLYLSGFIALVLGLLIVIGHNVWNLTGALLVTLIGWLTLVKALAILFFPDAYSRFGMKYIKGNGYMAGTVISLLAGIFLLYYGFFS